MRPADARASRRLEPTRGCRQCGGVSLIRSRTVAEIALGVACGVALMAATVAPAVAQPERPTPSGLPVPRWVSLKSGQINARVGPGNDYKILWTYRTRGLPVQVIAETRDWRRVCDPRGGVAWVNAGTTSGRRMVMRAKPQPLPVRAKPDAALKRSHPR